MSASVTGDGPGFFQYQGIAPSLEGIPVDLAHVPQWVLWKAAPTPPGGMNKIPFQPNGRPASSTDPSTWADFGTVWAAYEEEPSTYAGVGFVLTEQDRFIGGDLDHCRDVHTGELTPLATRIVAGISTYWEVTPSGTGLRFFATGDGGRSFRGRGIEVYTAGRFLTVTGQRHGDIPEPAPIPAAAVARLRELATGHRDNGAGDPGQTPDPIIVAIQAAGLYQRALENGRHLITCPWWQSHSGGDKSGTVYMAAHHAGHSRASFVCSHSHCGDKRLPELLDFLNVPSEAPAAPAEVPPALIKVDLAGLAEAELAPPTYIVKPIIPRAQTTLFGGHGGSGKTLVALIWAAHLAIGKAWGPFDMPACRVLFVSMEDDGALVRYRLKRIAAEYGLPVGQLAERLEVIDASEAEPLAVEASTFGVRSLTWTGFAEQVRAKASTADLVVIDNATDAFGGDENSRRQVRAFIKGLTRMVRGHGGAVLLLAHIDKSAARFGAKGNSYSGSTGWHNSVRSRLALADDQLVHEKLNVGRKMEDPIPLVWGESDVPRPGVLGVCQVSQTDAADDAAVLACLRAAVLAGVYVPVSDQGPNTTWHCLSAFTECPAELRAPEGKPRVRAALIRLARGGKIRRFEYKTPQRKYTERWELTA